MLDLRAIVMRLGGDLSDGGRKARIPGPGHKKRDRSMSLRITDEGRLLYYSFAGDTAEAMRDYLGLEQVSMFRSVEFAPRLFRMAEIRAEQNRKLSFCRELWNRSVCAQGTPRRITYVGAGLVSTPCPRLSGSAPMRLAAT